MSIDEQRASHDAWGSGAILSGPGKKRWLWALEPDEAEKNELGEPPTGAIDYDAYCFLTSHVVHGTIKGISDRSAVNE